MGNGQSAVGHSMTAHFGLSGDSNRPAPLPIAHCPLPSTARTGVLGGTFDPVHLGHLILAEEARWALRLERLVLMPAAQPWRKAERQVTAADHRLAMLRLAVADDPSFDVSTLEIDRGGPTYTVETLAALRSELGEGVELVFVLGEDALLDLPHWRDPAGILRLARLGVAKRPGTPPIDLAALERVLPGIEDRIEMIPMPLIEISSTDIRRRVREGGTIRYLVPAPVQAYIAEHALYRAR
jgi:nicotinate-nucleotide adenylyltransferase